MNIEKFEDLQHHTEREIRDILGSDTTKVLKRKLHKMALTFQDERPEVLLGIDCLGLSVRTYRATKQKYSTIGSLLSATEKELRTIRGIGPKSRDELIQKVHALGFCFDFEREKKESFNRASMKYLSLKQRRDYLLEELNKVNKELENSPKQYIK